MVGRKAKNAEASPEDTGIDASEGAKTPAPKQAGKGASKAKPSTYSKRRQAEIQATQEVGPAEDTEGPKQYSDRLAESLLLRMSLGETLTSICRDPKMPSQTTVHRWKRARRDFAEAFNRARVDQARAWADQIIDLADDNKGDLLLDSEGNPVLSVKTGEPIYVKDMPARARLKVEARQWLMERVARDDYGQRVAMDMTATIEAKDDAELLHDIGEAMAAAGMTPEMLVSLLTPATKPN